MPKSIRGFTLIELLVTISIIAILSLIAITMFTGVQKSARDAKRIQDIDSIAKNMEIHFGQCTGTYCNLDTSWFGGGVIPSDPTSGNKCANGNSDFCGYCFSNLGTQPGGNPNWANHGCSNNHSGGLTGYFDSLVKPGAPGDSSGFNYAVWILCANLETQVSGKYYYCRQSQQ